MAIYSIRDLRDLAPDELKDAPDSVLINEYAKDAKLDPLQVADYFGYNNNKGMAANRIAAGVDNYQANMYGLGGAVSRKLGAQGAANWFDQRREANELDANTATQRARRLGAIDDWREVDGIGSGLNYLGGLASQSLPYLGEAAAGALTGGLALTGTAARLGLSRAAASGAARTTGAVAASYPSAVGDVLSAQRDAGGENLGSAAVGGIPYAALNALGVEGMIARGFRPLAVGTGGLGRRVATGAGVTALTEGIAETGQEGINQYFGRMAVDPNETLFNEQANKRYIDSFVGGASLGGAFGGAGGIRGPRVQRDEPTDLISDAPVSPSFVVGQPTLSTQDFINQNLGLNRRRTGSSYPQAFTAAFDEPSGIFVSDPQTGVERELSMGELQQRQAGFSSERSLLTDTPTTDTAAAPEVQARWNELTNKLSAKEGLTDAEIQELGQLTRALQGQTPAADTAATSETAPQAPAAPTLLSESDRFYAEELGIAVPQGKVRRAALENLYNAAVESGVPLDSPALEPYWTQIGAGSFYGKKQQERLRVLLQNAIVEHRRSQDGGANVSGTSVVAGRPAGSSGQSGAVADGSVGTGGSDPAVRVERDGGTGNTGAATGQTVPLASTSAPSTANISDPFQVAVDDSPRELDTAEQNRLEIARMTGQGGVADAIEEAAAGRRIDDPTAGDEATIAAEIDKVLKARFGTTPMGKRQAQIARAYLTAMRSAPEGSKIAVQEAIGKQFGIKPVTVRKYGNTNELVATAKRLGYTDAQARNLFEIKDNTKAKAGEAVKTSEENPNVAGALQELGITTVEGENAGFGMDDSNTWKLANAKEGIGDVANATDETLANQIDSHLQAIADFEQTIEEFEAQGLTEVAEQTRAKIEEEQTKLDAAMQKYAKYLENKQTKKAKAASGEMADQAETETEPEAQELLRMVRGDTVDVIAPGLRFEGSIADEPSLRRFPGIDSAIQHYERNGLRHVVDGVQLWMVVPNSVNFDAAILEVDGKQTLAIRSGILTDTTRLEWSMHHELGHIADDAFRTGGVHSSAPEMRVALRRGEIIPVGSVMREVASFKAANPDSDFSNTMQYPLSRTAHPKLSADEVRTETFAQLWAMFNTRDGRMFLEDNLPTTLEFMEVSYEATKQDQDRSAAETNAAGTRQGQAGQTNRGAKGGGAAVSNILRAAKEPQPLNSPRPTQGTIQKNIAQLPQPLQGPVRTAVNILGDAADKGLDYVVFTHDLVKRAVDAGISSAKTFENLLVQRGTRVRELEREVERIADMYVMVPDADRTSTDTKLSVNDFLFESTRTGKWGYGQYTDQEMKRYFDQLSASSQEFIKAVFAHGDKILAQKKKAVMDHTTTEYDARIADETDPAVKAELEKDKANSLKRFESLFKLREGKPYAPIKRTGNYVVVAKSDEYLKAEREKDKAAMAKLEKDEDHYSVTFRDTKNQARELAEKLAASGLYQNSDSGVYFLERDKHTKEMYGGDGVLKALENLRKRIEGSDDAGAAKMLRMVSDLYLEALAEGSARKSEMRRRGIAGEVDMLASFAQQGRADANFIASVQFNEPVQDALRQMSKQAKNARASEIRNELMARYLQSLDSQEAPLINKLTRLSSIWHLATSPSYYMQNLTQPWMMSVPAMAGKHDYNKVSGELWTAYSQLKDVMASAKLLKQSFDLSKVPDDVREAVQELANRGKIDIGLETEMGEFKVEGRGELSDRWNRIDRGLRLAVQKVETINRLSTAIAAYRLEFAKTKGNKQQALDYADRILTETHGDYTSFNAPRLFNTKVGKVALQFRKFQLIQLSFYAKLIRDAYANPVERKAALRSLTFGLAHTAALAGVRGLPGYAAFAWALSKLFGDDDEPYDLTLEMRKAIGDKDLANLILNGAPTIAGMDLSGKVGAGNMLSILPFSNADLTTDQGRKQVAGELLLGASGGMASRFLDGAGLMLSGDWYRGLEQMMPKGFSDAFKAYREMNDGMTRRNGDVILAAEDISELETIWTALGLTGIEKSNTYERRQRARGMDQNFQDRSTKLKNQYAKAFKDRDTQGMREAREAWIKLQEARVRNGYSRQPLSTLLKAPKEQTKRERNTVGGVQTNRNNQGFARMQADL